MREKFMRFMYGRYGVDSFGKFLLAACIICYLLSHFKWLWILYPAAVALLIYSYFRMLSRNIYKRAAENQKYLSYTAKIRGFWNKEKNLMQQRKTHHIYKCPNCKQKIRVPKGKGKIEIRCPKCQGTFVRRS